MSASMGDCFQRGRVARLFTRGAEEDERVRLAIGDRRRRWAMRSDQIKEIKNKKNGRVDRRSFLADQKMQGITRRENDRRKGGW